MWGESAKEALRWAKEAYERVVRIEAQIGSVGDAVHKYETRSDAAQRAFELRMEQRFAALEASVRAELRDFEGRLRLLESHVSSVNAKVEGGLAQAAGLIYAERAAHVRRDSGITAVAHREESSARLGDGTSDS
jgi:hypothetical protein